MLPVDPPLLSDHALIVADCACQPSSIIQPAFRQVRNWRNLDVDAFAADLERSVMAVAPPEDVNTAFDQYDSTLINMLDKHAPMKLKRLSLRQSARWYDAECRATKRSTRQLERKYRRLPTDESLAAWRSHINVSVYYTSQIHNLLVINNRQFFTQSTSIMESGEWNAAATTTTFS